MKKHSTRTLELFCAKNRSKKPQIFEKWDDFENRPSRKGYSPCKGYSLCKMISLGQKLKMPKTCEKPFYKNIRVVLFKKPVKKTQIFKKWDDFENRPSCKGYSPCKGSNLCKMGSLGQKLKIPKHVEKGFENRPSCIVYTPWKGYNLYKMVSLGQKLKIPKPFEKPFHKNIRVVLYKKTAGKNTKYSRNETILKIGHLAKAIHLIPKWRPINYSFVCMLISPLCLIFTLKLFCL